VSETLQFVWSSALSPPQYFTFAVTSIPFLPQLSSSAAFPPAWLGDSLLVIALEFFYAVFVRFTASRFLLRRHSLLVPSLPAHASGVLTAWVRPISIFARI